MLDASCSPAVQTVTAVFPLVFPPALPSDMKTVLTLCSLESVKSDDKRLGFEHGYIDNRGGRDE